MSAAKTYFEILGLPAKPVDSERLRAAFQQSRTVWFLRQYIPEYLGQARRRLKELDEAFDALKDPRRQSAILREIRQYARTDPLVEEPAVPPVNRPEPKPLEGVFAMPRAKVVRKLEQVAAMLVKRHKRPLNETELKTLTRIAFRMGLDYPEASQLVARIAASAAASLRSFPSRERLLQGEWNGDPAPP